MVLQISHLQDMCSEVEEPSLWELWRENHEKAVIITILHDFCKGERVMHYINRSFVFYRGLQVWIQGIHEPENSPKRCP